MISGFSKLTIAAPDLDKATSDYSLLLGEFSSAAATPCLPLSNIGIELCTGAKQTEAAISELTLWRDSSVPGGPALPQDCRGLALQLSQQREVSSGGILTSTGILGVDHIVLQTRDADDCIRLFGESGLGMRLALDQSVPEWGGRMLFFRCGKLTLEVIHNQEQPPERDSLWGLTFLCPDLELTLATLDANGVEHSGLRAGRKPGTRVATVKSHDLGIPTLLLEPASR
ncbi:MAG: VOC family protein [Halieaceae bacterium]